MVLYPLPGRYDIYGQSILFNFLLLIVCYDKGLPERFESVELHQCIYFTLSCCLVRNVVGCLYSDMLIGNLEVHLDIAIVVIKTWRVIVPVVTLV